MTKLSWLIVLSLGELAAFAQGDVVFGNIVNFQTPGDRLVRYSDGVPLVGTNWCAQLFYGVDQLSLVPVLAPPRRFFDGSTTPPGVWNSAWRDLTGFSPGQTVVLDVRVWDGARFLDFEMARLAGESFGQSAPFSYTIPEPGSFITAYYMEDFRGFSLVPEPTSLVLVTLGGALAFARLLRRRK